MNKLNFFIFLIPVTLSFLEVFLQFFIMKKNIYIYYSSVIISPVILFLIHIKYYSINKIKDIMKCNLSYLIGLFVQIISFLLMYTFLYKFFEFNKVDKLFFEKFVFLFGFIIFYYVVFSILLFIFQFFKLKRKNYHYDTEK